MAKNKKQNRTAVKKKSSGVSLANILSTLGYVIFGLLTFFGYQMMFKGDMAQAIIFTAATLAVISFFLWFLIYTKTRENDAKKWFIVEVSTGVVLVALVALFGAKPVLHSTSIISNKEALLEALSSDQREIQNLLQNFYEKEEALIKDMVSSSGNFEPNKFASDSLSADVLPRVGVATLTGNGQVISSNITVKEAAEKFSDHADKLRKAIFGVNNAEIENQTKEATDRINAIREAVSNMDFFGLPEAGADMNKLNEDLVEWFNKQSAQPARFKLVNISKEELQAVPLSMTYEKSTKLKFQDTLAGSDGVKTTTLGVVLLLLSLLLIYLPYMLSNRTLILPIGKSKVNDGGVNLFD